MYPSGNGFKSTNLKRITRKRKQTTEFIIDETMIKIGSNYMFIWVAIESESKEILGISVSKERNILIAEHFISSLTKG